MHSMMTSAVAVDGPLEVLRATSLELAQLLTICQNKSIMRVRQLSGNCCIWKIDIGGK